jgi:hypothetical protein
MRFVSEQGRTLFHSLRALVARLNGVAAAGVFFFFKCCALDVEAATILDRDVIGLGAAVVDGSTCGVRGAWLESASRWNLVALLVVSAAVISAAVWFLAPDLSSYRGLSGVDSALAAAVAVGLYKTAEHPLAARSLQVRLYCRLLQAALL